MWPHYAVLFISSAGIMTLELVAGRLAAPYIGVSLYSWTGVIAAVLAGISGGSLVGGWLADRLHPRALLGGALLVAAGLAAAMLPLTGPVFSGLTARGGPPLFSIFLPALLVFGIPSCALAVISPAVYKLAVRDLGHLGGTVGRLAAAGILGSIVGTYATGFFLVAALGVRTIVLGVAAAHLLLGVVVLVLARGAAGRPPGPEAAPPATAQAEAAQAATGVTPRTATHPRPERPAARARTRARPAPAGQPRSVAPRLSAHMVLVVACAASAAIMAMEMVGGRLLAPAIGANLYAWTSVIGGVLLGMTLGSLGGGYLADRHPSGTALGHLLGWAGAVCAWIVPGGPALVAALLPNGLPALAGIGLPTLVLVLPASLLLGAVTPLCYKLAVTGTDRVGRTAGAMGAAAALGSIVGTLSAGYWLIPTIGSLATAFAVALALAMLAAAVFWQQRRPVWAPALLAVALVTLAAVRPGLLRTPDCDVESAYFCIRVDEFASWDGKETLRMLVLDHLIHSGVNLSKPDELWYEYEQVTAWALRSLGRPDLKTLFLGGGGYVMPHWVERNLTASSVDVAEIDPQVTRIALRDFVPQARRIRTLQGDARMVLASMPPQQVYDVVLGDAFNDVSVPYHLTTLEFGRLVRSHLTPGGMYVVNVVDRAGGDFLGAFARTLAQVFPYVDVLPGEARVTGFSTYIVVAANTAVPWSDWQARNPPPFALPVLTMSGRPALLTDDYAPVDNLLLPVLNLRWQQ